MNEKEREYRMAVQTGDIVKMPNGTVGVVNFWDITGGGHCKEVRVYPFTNWFHRLFLVLFCKDWFYDSDINKLQLISNFS
jgi:hypothetical protein